MAGRGALVALAFAAAPACASERATVRLETSPRSTPSGQPVPRYVSTKFATVNARSGPGDDYRLVWTFHARGLPLQVIAETEDWRRVCDPDGGVSWVHRRTVGEARTVLRASTGPLPLRRAPTEGAPAQAVLSGRSIAALKGCTNGWCRLSADRAQGWAPQGEVWGATDAPQCGRPSEPLKLSPR